MSTGRGRVQSPPDGPEPATRPEWAVDKDGGMTQNSGEPTVSTNQLSRTLIEIERHVAADGWDQPVRLYALVDTADLVQREPVLAERLGIDADDEPGHPLTPIEQEQIAADQPLEDFLAGIAWPETVRGCALVVERLMLPPAAEAELDALDSAEEDPAELLRRVASHPQRQDVRIAVGVLRDGTRESALRMRGHDSDQSVLSGADLVVNLAEALHATFEE